MKKAAVLIWQAITKIMLKVPEKPTLVQEITRGREQNF